MQIRSRLLVLASISAAATILVGAVALFCGSQVQQIAKENILIGVAIRHHLEADMMHDAIRGDTLAALLALSTQRMDEKEKIVDDFKNHVDVFLHAIEENSQLDLGAANRNAIDEIKPALDNYINSGNQLIEAVFSANNPDKSASVARLKEKFTVAFEDLEERNGAVSDLLTESLRASEQQLDHWESLSKSLNAAIIIVMLAISTLVGLAIVRSINQSIRKLVDTLSVVVTDGNFSHRVTDYQKDEIGDAADAFNALLQSTQECISGANNVLALAALGNLDERIANNYRGDLARLADGINTTIAQISDAQHKQALEKDRAERAALEAGQLAERISRQAEKDQILARENFRIRMALDSVSTNAMIADANGDIIYANRAVVEMMRRNEANIRQKIPQLNVDKLIGSSFDIFHRNPGHQRNLLATLQNTHRTQINVAGLTFRLTANPILDNGERLGTVLEWDDRTQEVAIEKEIEDVVSAAAGGNFNLQLQVEGKTGFFLSLSEHLNRLITVTRSALEDIATVVGSIAEGELRISMKNNYQGMFGQVQADIERTVDQLTETITGIYNAANSIAQSSREVDEGTNDLSRRNEDQAASLEQTAASMEQMTESVQQSATNARDTSELVKTVQKRAEVGTYVVTNAVDAMNGIRTSSKKIVDIVSIIDDIAFQTNLLALNAAVEASRAGEHGRGFAVVASEVRNLAQHSSSAAKDIRVLINESVSRIEDGVKLVNETGGSLHEIEQMVGKAAGMVESIATALKEQATGISEVNKAVARMDQATQQNAAMVEESSAAAANMTTQCDEMTGLISFFKM